MLNIKLDATSFLMEGRRFNERRWSGLAAGDRILLLAGRGPRAFFFREIKRFG